MRKSPTITYDIGHCHRYEQGLVGSVKSLLIEIGVSPLVLIIPQIRSSGTIFMDRQRDTDPWREDGA